MRPGYQIAVRISSAVLIQLLLVVFTLYLVLFSINLGDRFSEVSDPPQNKLLRTPRTLILALLDTNEEVLDNTLRIISSTHTGFIGLSKPLFHTVFILTLTYLLLTVISLPLGMVMGYHSNFLNKLIYYPLRLLGAVPDFVLAILLYYAWYMIFGEVAGTQEFSVKEYNQRPPYYIFVDAGMALDYLKQIWLPLTTLLIANGALGNIAHGVKVKCKAVLREEYITVARARGVPEKLILWKHALRNVIPEFCSLLSGRVPHLIGSVIVVEWFFSRGGLGNELLLRLRELPSGVSDFFAAALLIALLSAALNIVFQWLVTVADPRWTR